MNHHLHIAASAFTTASAMFVVAALPAKAGIVSTSQTAPTINDADLASYGAVSGTDKWWVSSSEPDSHARGQTFVTGPGALRLKSLTYQTSSASVPSKNFIIRVGKISGTTFTQTYSETATQSANWNAGDYVTWAFSSPPLLEGGTVYGVDVGMTSSVLSWSTGIPYLNLTDNEFPGGARYTSGTTVSGVGSTTVLLKTGDTIFHLDLETPLGGSLEFVAGNPPDNATSVLLRPELVATFSRNLVAASGNITLRNLTDATETVLPINDPAVSVSNNLLKIQAAGLINWNKSYALRIDADALKDENNNSFAGIFDNATWNFTTAAADPFLDAVASLKNHIVNGATTLNATQIAEIFDIIVANKLRFPESAQTISAVFDLVAAYDVFKGPSSLLTIGVNFGDRRTQTKTLDWTVYQVMQTIVDEIYTPATIAAYQSLLTGFKLGVSTNFPGICAPPVDPSDARTVPIQGSFEDTFGRDTQAWTTPARKPTGTYLAPGTFATVTVPPSLVNKGYKVRVGCHSWDLETRRNEVRRLDRVTTVFPIDATTIKVASPCGGGIYIEVPFRANAGVANITVTGAVRSPYFSAKSFHQTTTAEWNVEKTHPAPWADFQSDKFMTQVPRTWIYNHPNPAQMMADWDAAMDAINSLMGFPLVRGKETMYPQVDVIMRSSVHAPGYPAVNVTQQNANFNGYSGYKDNYLVRGPNVSLTAANIEFHEQGHAYGFPKFGGESESNVNLLQPAMLNRKFNRTFDEAQNGSFGSSRSFITIDNTAVAWMTVFNFSPREVPMADAEKAYQHKGHAKWMDIARLFGWEKLDAYWRSFMLDDASGVAYSTSTDGLLLRLSRHVGKDIRPLFHFWGIHPQNPTSLAAAIAAENIPASIEIRNLLARYKTLVPANNATFRTFAQAWRGRIPKITGEWEEREHARQWDTTALYGPGDQQRSEATNPGEIYNENSANDIRNRVQELLDLYYPNSLKPTKMSFAIEPAAINATAIGMKAATAVSAVGPIEYYFVNITNNTNSGWIASTTWNSSNLTTGVTYSFRVQARDGQNNVTEWSDTLTATAQTDNTPPTISSLSFSSPPAGTALDEITMTANTATDLNGVEYFFECSTIGGHDSGWQDSPTYTDTDLSSGTEYVYQFKVRDKSPAQNTTAFSAPAAATTLVPDVTPPVIVSLSPADNASDVAPSLESWSITFNELIAANNGSITLNNLTDSIDTVIDITDDSQVTVFGSTLAINPSGDLLARKSYAVRIDATALRDLSGNSFSGITNDSAWNFTTAAVPYVWTQAAGGTQSWSTGVNWQGNAVPSPVADDTIDLSSANITVTTTLTLEADRTAKLWKFGDATVASHDWIVNAGNKMVLAGTTPTLQVVNRTATLNNIVDGASSLTKTGAGTLTLTNGSNSFSGGLIIEGGNVSTEGATSDPTGPANSSIAVKANSTFTLGNGFTTLAKSIALDNNSILSFGTGGGSPRSITGAVTGTGGIAVNTMGSLGQRTLILSSTIIPNNFTGPISQVTGNFADLILNSLQDASGAGAITYGEAGQGRTMQVTWGTGATAPLTLNHRVLAITGTTTSAIFNNNAPTAQIVTINTDLSVLTTGAKTFILGGSNTGNNGFDGDISNGAGSVSVTKAGAGIWAITGDLSHTGLTTASGGNATTGGRLLLSGTNTNTGGFSVSGNGMLVFQGKQSLAANSAISLNHGGGSNNGSSVRFLDDTVGTVTLTGTTVNIDTNNASGSQGIFVGNTNTANLGSGTGTTTNSTIEVANLVFNSLPGGSGAGSGVLSSITGANGYRLNINNVILNNLTGLNGGTTQIMGFSPTSANVTIGAVTMANGNTGATNDGAPVLKLDGTATDNRITGTISNAANFPTSVALSVQKTGSSVWTFSGDNTFSGGLTLSGATAGSQLNLNSPTALGIASFTISGGSNAKIDNTSGGPVTLTTHNAQTWSNDFTFVGTHSLDMGTGAVTIGANRSVTVTANTFTVGGVISGGAFNLTKAGSGTLVLGGTNAYTGLTTVSAGKLFINGDSSAATGNVTVSANATLGGGGVIGGATTIAPTGKLEFNLSTAFNSHDKLELAAGKLLVFSGASTLTLTSTGGASPGDYTLATAPGGFGTSVPPATVVLPAGWAADAPRFVGTALKINITSTGNVGPGPVASFEISAISSLRTVGTPITGITLTAKDASNATATGFTGTVTFGGTAGVTGTSANFVAGVLSGVSVTPTTAGSNLTLAVSDGASHTGSTTIATINPAVSAYETWASGAAFDADTNNDGVDNGMAWLLGAAGPSANAVGLLPTISNTDPTHFVFTYRRSDSSNESSGTTIAVQYGSNLSDWTTALHDGDNIIITPTDNFYGTNPGIDKVEVRIKRSFAGSKLFMRLNVTSGE